MQEFQRGRTGSSQECSIFQRSPCTLGKIGRHENPADRRCSHWNSIATVRFAVIMLLLAQNGEIVHVKTRLLKCFDGCLSFSVVSVGMNHSLHLNMVCSLSPTQMRLGAIGPRRRSRLEHSVRRLLPLLLSFRTYA